MNLCVSVHHYLYQPERRLGDLNPVTAIKCIPPKSVNLDDSGPKLTAEALATPLVFVI